MYLKGADQTMQMYRPINAYVVSKFKRQVFSAHVLTWFFVDIALNSFITAINLGMGFKVCFMFLNPCINVLCISVFAVFLDYFNMI